MSFPDPNSFWPQYPMNPNPEHSDLHDVPPPPFKRLRNSEFTPQNSAPFPPMYPKVNPPNLPGKGIGHIFYKTRMCAKFLEGTCRNGEHCSFAHGTEDMREPPPNWQELMREKERGPGNWADDQRTVQRMKICKRYWNGEECSYGDKCTFLHQRPEDKQRESAAISIGTTAHNEGTGPGFGLGPVTGPLTGPGFGFEQIENNKQVNVSSEAVRVKPVFWKTRMCTKWDNTGHCHFGDRCHYAHGNSELKVASNRVIQSEQPVVNPGPVPGPGPAPSVPVVDAVPATTTTTIVNAPIIEAGSSSVIMKNLRDKLKWTFPKKVNRIYADWIDDLSPPRGP